MGRLEYIFHILKINTKIISISFLIGLACLVISFIKYFILVIAFRFLAVVFTIGMIIFVIFIGNIDYPRYLKRINHPKKKKVVNSK